jgi:hypothetical protein
MTPREVIAQSLFDFSGSGQGVDDMLEAIAFEQSHAIFNDLKTAGYSIIHDSENHGPTRDRAAGIATAAGDTWSGSRDAFACVQEAAVDDKCEEIADAIRAMEVKPHG